MNFNKKVEKNEKLQKNQGGVLIFFLINILVAECPILPNLVLN